MISMIDVLLEHATGIEYRALKLLHRPEAYPGVPELEGDVVLRLMKFEGLGKYWVWVVTAAGRRHFVRRVVWDRPRDYRPGALSPTIYGADAALPGGSMEGHLAELRSLILPPFLADDTVGLDGVGFGVEHRSHKLSAGLYWWFAPPEGWRPLAEWFDRCVEVLQAPLPSHEDERGTYGA
jgi:hypothetical protein